MSSLLRGVGMLVDIEFVAGIFDFFVYGKGKGPPTCKQGMIIGVLIAAAVWVFFCREGHVEFGHFA